jgi:chromate transporter
VQNLIYLFRTFIVIGSTSFGGYMSLISMMRERMVMRDKAISDDRITEGLALASMLPGPVAVNVVAYTGFYLSGITGALISIISVLLPSFALVLALSILFLEAGSKIDFHSILLGIFPVVAGVIFSTGISMGKKNCTQIAHYAIATGSFIALVFLKGYWPILLVLLVAAGAGILLFKKSVSQNDQVAPKSWNPVLLFATAFIFFFVIIFLVSSESILLRLAKEFSAASLTLFGGGYVMVPILKTTLVDQLRWVSGEEFIYGISIGQVTPGPILISAAFFGYKMKGILGAIIATVSIFLPSAMLMIILSKVFIALKHNRFIQAALSGIRPAVVGMILYSGFSLYQLMTDANLYISFVIVALTFWLVFKYSFNTALLICAGAIVGFFFY